MVVSQAWATVGIAVAGPSASLPVSSLSRHTALYLGFEWMRCPFSSGDGSRLLRRITVFRTATRSLGPCPWPTLPSARLPPASSTLFTRRRPFEGLRGLTHEEPVPSLRDHALRILTPLPGPPLASASVVSSQRASCLWTPAQARCGFQT